MAQELASTKQPTAINRPLLTLLVLRETEVWLRYWIQISPSNSSLIGYSGQTVFCLSEYLHLETFLIWIAYETAITYYADTHGPFNTHVRKRWLLSHFGTWRRPITCCGPSSSSIKTFQVLVQQSQFLNIGLQPPNTSGYGGNFRGILDQSKGCTNKHATIFVQLFSTQRFHIC